MKTTDCGCDGKHHLLENGRWVPCSCLRLERERRSWRAAGLPRRYDAETGKTFLERFRFATAEQGRAVALMTRALRSGAGNSEKLELVIHGQEDGRDLLAVLLARAALRGGIESELCDLRRLIDFEFGRAADGVLEGDPRRRGLTALRLGDEPRNAMNRPAFERFLRARYDASLPTILTCSIDPRSLGAIYSSDEVATAIAERFQVAEIRSR